MNVHKKDCLDQEGIKTWMKKYGIHTTSGNKKLLILVSYQFRDHIKLRLKCEL
ncbi:hypothetical protein H312_00639 [Anncaliia algerae PRA339]|uniref:Uncharacterized protein n=1 Tax=Anncaliia algerae PRA339 TaxID=1288291 RepID=A0A059F3U6_9MICR|nr:hypothetical protein H312_00639 [Anncaliia algerae PRA339]